MSLVSRVYLKSREGEKVISSGDKLCLGFGMRVRGGKMRSSEIDPSHIGGDQMSSIDYHSIQ